MRVRALGWLGALAAGAMLGGAAEPESHGESLWRDTALARLEALALIQTLNGEILASSSATQTLEQWCREHQLAAEPRIIAQRIDAAALPPTTAQRQELDVSADEPVRYRRVELRCGEHLLSVADNWYVPARLTAEMNRLLERTQTPFGIVVRPLHPHRETFEAQVLWSPLPTGWERAAPERTAPAAGTRPQVPASAAAAALLPPAALFEHRAILYTPQQRPIAEVHEVYQRDLLAFPQPSLEPEDP